MLDEICRQGARQMLAVALERARLCALVVLRVRHDGHKELVAIGEGHRESAEAWEALLRDLRHRGMKAPMVAVGDGAPSGSGRRSGSSSPRTREQRDWFHEAGNVLGLCRPRQAAPAKKLLSEIRDAEDKEHARIAAQAFSHELDQMERSSSYDNAGSLAPVVAISTSRKSPQGRNEVSNLVLRGNRAVSNTVLHTLTVTSDVGELNISRIVVGRIP